ncbi:membrane integrity-associated transporter subunit PqiC [Castellaniella hirudinis]|uniref:PqiC family protein n=1 Tax=Castellaniella hirudinis TaxID=1144617 RepID=UPI0039C28A18
MRRWEWMLGGLLLGTLGGCASLPVQYFSLAPSDPAMAAASARPAGPKPAADYALRLAVVSVPAEANRLQLLVRDPAVDPAVEVLNQSLWSAPLKDQIQSVLGARVGAELGVPDLQGMAVGAEMPVREINVRVTKFELIWGQGTALDAVWVDRAAQQSRLCWAQVRTSGGGQAVAALVEQQRQAVQRLAVAMAGKGAAPGGEPGSGMTLESGCT